MRPQSHRWRDDRLGTTLRSGVRPLAEAEPSDEVWQRIASDVAARRNPRPRRVSFHRASLLSVVLLVGLAATGLGVQLNASGQATIDWSTSRTVRLSATELSLAQRAAAGEWDRIMPPDPVPARRAGREHREAYNRTQWLALARAPLGGTVAPLQSLAGQ